jgi:hypothetical protein
MHTKRDLSLPELPECAIVASRLPRIQGTPGANKLVIQSAQDPAPSEPDGRGIHIGPRSAGRNRHRRPDVVCNLTDNATGASPGPAACRREGRPSRVVWQVSGRAAKLYSEALQNRRDDIIGMIGIYALTNRIRLTSSPQVVEAADTVCRIIVDTYLAPNMTLEEMRANWIDRHIDPLRDFSEACRQELQTFGRY